MHNNVFTNPNDPEVPFPNKYVYIKQNFVPVVRQPPVVASKVLVNPHFNKKVFLNPNYKPNNIQHSIQGQIHINPNVAKIHLQEENVSSKIHINPNVLKSIAAPSKPDTVKQPIAFSSKTKLIRKPVKEQPSPLSKRIRRSSIYSKFEIVKCSVLTTPSEKSKNKLLFNTKYKLKRICTNNIHKSDKCVISQNKSVTNRYKLDRRKKSISNSSSRFVFVNRFVSISDIAKKLPLKTKGLVNVSGMRYKKPSNTLQRTYSIQKDKKHVKEVNSLMKNRFKLVRPQIKQTQEKKNSSRIISRYSSRKISTEKLKKCNIPCQFYRKFGKCKRKELGKCNRKHDPDQIALCTKFLQGACIDSKCLLSHNVSSEKMPTCKYYLEGFCSKDCCPYLHVRISPKADICRDFLEGFCKKASECDKRHQFLCPDYEKKGACQKSRCSYPHGRMVRKYSVFNKNKFAKKSSKNTNDNASSSKDQPLDLPNNMEEIIKTEGTINNRYYSDKNKENVQNCENAEFCDEIDSNFKMRPKLGELPSFISFEDT